MISDRERIARDLHDVVIQRLFATGLQLQGVASLAGDSEVATRLERAVDDLDVTIKAIRGTIFELQHRAGRLVAGRDPRPGARVRPRARLRARSWSPAAPSTPPYPPRCVSSCCPCCARRSPTSPGTRWPTRPRSRCTSADRSCGWPSPTTASASPEERSESGLRNVRRRAAELGGTVELARNVARRDHPGLAGAAHPSRPDAPRPAR